MTIEKAPRQSVTFTPETYAELARLSKEKKVSIAWVVREATERYIAEQQPSRYSSEVHHGHGEG